MKVPCCSVCHSRYNEEERVPLLLQCGHGFCKDCLSRMFASSPDTTLPCPRCRHISVVGNSVLALRKNYAILALIHSNSAALNSHDCDFTDDDEDEDDEGENNGYGDDLGCVESRARGSRASSSCGPVIEVGVHQDLRLVRRIGEGRQPGVGMWAGVIGSKGGRCRHRVAVKKVVIGEGVDLDWVQGQLEKLRTMSMWCRNVCVFHGAVRMDGSLCLIMDKCAGSVQSEMQKNEGRLTLEQILRFHSPFFK